MNFNINSEKAIAFYFREGSILRVQGDKAKLLGTFNAR